MAITGGGNIYIFEDDRGFNYRGLWNSSTTYNAGDVVYYGSPQTAYLANATVTTTTPTTQNSGWSRLARRGTDGATGRAGDYTILLFARSVNEPRRPDSTDASYPADVGNFASTVWSRFEIPSGTAPVWMSWIRVVISTSSLEFGQVFRLSGEDGTGTKGDPGDSISAQYSPDGTTDWSATLRVTDKYVRFRIGTGSWSIANKFVGDDGASAQIQYSPDGSTDWVNTGRTTDEYIRFRVGTMPWSIAYKIHGEDGQSISFQFSPDNSVWHSGNPRSNDKYIRFQVGTNAPTAGIKFVGEDGTDGDHSLELRYSQGPTTPLHEDFQPGDKYISFRIGRTGPFGTRIKFVGDDGANAPNMIVQFASQPVAARFGAFVAGDQYIRFSSDGGTTWVPEANGVRFVGEAGQSVTGEGISFEFSQDGQAGWHATLAADDYFIRLQQGSRGWQTAVQFRAYPLQIQYSIDGSTLWHTTFVQGTDKYIRFSNDNGSTWTAGDRFVGEDGADQLMLQYSPDGLGWDGTLDSTDTRIRFSTDGGTTWSSGIRFVGQPGGFEATLYQRSPTQPTILPTTATYDYRTGLFTNLGSWAPNAPAGTTPQLWELRVFVPHQSTRRVSVGVRGSPFSNKGADGSDGDDGRWYRPVFQWSVNEPTDPSGLSYNVPNGTIDGLGQWREAPRQQGSANERLWVAIIRIDGSTATYVLKFQYPSIAGPAGSQGDSIDVIYQRASNAPATPTGGTWNGSDYDPPSGWHESIPGGSNLVWMCIVTLSGTNRTNAGISYGSVVRISGNDGQDGTNADPVQFQYSDSGTGGWGTYADSSAYFRTSVNGGISWSNAVRFKGQDGTDGLNAPGVGTQIAEAKITWDQDLGVQTLRTTKRSNNFDPFTAGTRDIKGFTGGVTGLAVSDPGQRDGIIIAEAGAYSFVLQAAIQIRTTASRPAEIAFILKIDDSEDTNIAEYVQAAFTNTLTADQVITGNFTTPIVTVPASARVYFTISYRDPRTLSGIGTNLALQYYLWKYPGADSRLVVRRYTNAAGTGGGAAGAPGSSIDIVYRRSSTALTIPPTGGTASDGELTAAPTDWSTSVPSGSDPVYTAIAHIDGSNNSITYDEPIRWQGEDGTDGTNADPVQFQYSDNNNGPWSATYSSSNVYFRTSVNGGTTWSSAVRFRGVDGTTPSDGTDGTDGNSVTVIYQRAISLPGTPTGGTWNGSDYDPPSGWHESLPSGDDPAYMVVVHLSGTNKTNTGITYDTVIRITGEDGQDAPGIGDNVDTVRFNFVGDTSDQTLVSRSPLGVSTYSRVFHDIKAFTGGTAGLATQDATGITIPNAGVYSFVIQMDIEVFAGSNNYPDSEWGITLRLETSDGTLINDFAGNVFINDGDINADFTAPINRALPPISLPAGTKAFLRLFYQRIQSGSTGTATTQDFVFRVVNPTDMDDRFVVRRYTTTGSPGGNGSNPGNDGNSLDVIYRRSSTTLTTPPTGGTAHEGTLVSAPSGWSTTVPSGTDPIYVAFAHINGVTQSIRYSEPVRWQGTDGTDGAKGDSIVALWRTAATRPATPSGLAINSSGTWTDLTDSNGDAWRIDPIEPSGGLNLYQQNFEVDWAGPTLTALGQPFQAFVRGADGIGRQGAGGQSITFFYRRTTASTAPTQPGITYNGTAFGNFGDWAPDNIPSGSGNHVWRVAVAYQLGVNGQRVTSVFEYTAVVYNYIPIFMRSTTVPGTAPAIGTWDGTTYTPSTGWSLSAPAATQTELVVMQWTRLTQTSPYTIQNVGVPQLSSLMLPAGMVTPPPPSRTSYTMNYGLVTGGPSYTISATQTTSAIELATGETGMFDFTTPATTQTSPDWYFDLPVGLTLVSIQQRQGGQYFLGTQDWTIDDSSQPRRYMNDDQYSGTFGIIRVNVRRA